MGNLVKEFAKKILFRLFSSRYIFMFHHVTDTPEPKMSGCSISFEQFTTFVLGFKGEYVSVEELLRSKNRNKIAITFDDGLYDLYTLAYPFLKEHNIPFTAFILTDKLDAPGYITTQQLQEMSLDPIVTIGSHGVTHEVFPSLTIQQKQVELLESKRILEELIQRPVRYFAYSHGQFDDETLSMVKVYEYAFGTRALPINALTNTQFNLPRYNIETGRLIELKKTLPYKRKKKTTM